MDDRNTHRPNASSWSHTAQQIADGDAGNTATRGRCSEQNPASTGAGSLRRERGHCGGGGGYGGGGGEEDDHDYCQ